MILLVSFVLSQDSSPKVKKPTPNIHKSKCNLKCDHTTKMRPFYVKDKSGQCILLHHDCLLQQIQCEKPELGLVKVLDGSCGNEYDKTEL